MSMHDAIKNFHKQFTWEPKIENESKWKKFDKFVVAGMGGSHWAADLIKTCNPYLNITIHHDYGLPPLSDKELKESLVVISSYSGSTEEALDAYKTAREKNLSVAAVSIGGKLIPLAQKDGLPHVQMPDTGIQPRSAVGFSFRGLLKIMGEGEALKESDSLADLLKTAEYEHEGRNIAKRIHNKIPVIYSSIRNGAIAHNWRIRFNETAKAPSYANVFPELNHNEMTGFDVVDSTKNLSNIFYFIFLKDSEDHPRIKKRMEVTEKMYKARGLPVEILELRGRNVFHKIFSSLLTADWTSYYLGESYGVETEEVPMVEEFKKLIA